MSFLTCKEQKGISALIRKIINISTKLSSFRNSTLTATHDRKTETGIA